jgi:hypothetical protein
MVQMAEMSQDDERHYTVHAFRAGSALAAFLAGVPLITIMTQGC